MWHLSSGPAGRYVLVAMVLTGWVGASKAEPAVEGAGEGGVLQALQRCRTLIESSERLVCYDRVLEPLSAPAKASPQTVLPSGPLSAAPPAVAPTGARPTPAAKAEPKASGPAYGTGALGVASGLPEAQKAGKEAVAQFGLPRPASLELQQLESTLPGAFTGWTRGHRFALANGQVWEVIDNSVGAYRLNTPKVTVQRGFLGSYFLEIEGVQQTPRVRRIK